MALVKCAECGKEISDKAESCPNCGFVNKEYVSKENGSEINESEVHNQNYENFVDSNTKQKTSFEINKIIKNKKNILAVLILAVIIIAIVIACSKKVEDSKAIKVDITMNAWYGDIEEILDDFGIEFYAVTGGANCYSGTKTNSFETEKYGILYTEFTYCKSNKVQRFRLYNKSSDQELREPKPGEINTYDSYGERKSSTTM